MTEGQKRIRTFLQEEYDYFVRYVRGLIANAAEGDAEDIVQDVMLNFLDRSDITVPIENLRAYLFRSLRNRVIDIFRRRKPQVSLDAPISKDESQTLAEVIRDQKMELSSELAQQELYDHLHAAIDELAEYERAVIIATEFEGKSFRELSETWGVPINTLLSQKARAIKKIKVKLGNHD